jgi:hypothetical protein
VTPHRITLALTLPVAAVTAAAYALGPLTLRAPEALLGLGTGLLAIGAGALLPEVARSRAVTTPAVREWLERAADPLVATGALTLVMTLGTVASAVLTPWGGPTVDSALAWPETAIGLTQADVWTLAERADVLPELATIYASPALQVKAAALWWVAVGQDSRPLWRCVVALAVCVLVGMPLYVVLPAEGPSVFYGSADPGAWHAAWSAMRAGPCVVDRLFGTVAAPSFHVVFSVLLARLWWGTPMFLAAVVINVAMLLATMVIGEHYAADIVLGMLIVSGSMCVESLLLDGWAHRAGGARDAR